MLINRRKLLQAKGGEVVIVHVSAMTCELLATFLPLKVPLGAIEIEDQSTQILKEIQWVKDEQWQRNSNSK